MTGRNHGSTTAGLIESGALRSAQEARDMAERLIARFDTIEDAGRAYEFRHGLKDGAGARILHRLRCGDYEYVRDETYDRLWVMM